MKATFFERWWPVARVSDLTDGPVARIWVGEPVALFRTPDGVACLKDECPHRKARLSSGYVCGGEIVCAEHGWRFDGNGECTGSVTTVTKVTSGAKEVRQPVQAYRAVALFGYVFIAGRCQPWGS